MKSVSLSTVSSSKTICCISSAYRLFWFSITCNGVVSLTSLNPQQGITKIPWFSFGPFHAAVGILTVRMLLILRKATAHDVYTIGLTDIHIEGLEHDIHKEDSRLPLPSPHRGSPALPMRHTRRQVRGRLVLLGQTTLVIRRLGLRNGYH
ncbi:hypothetical protein BDN71DRAFT_604864 [Pleurotus eryngii]|uniref:Uncharacterized protein n=1 Tax=Pleurotus eryngii TaxID=5323 RepID=A0A9P6A3V7_PLEER|nr:hypothetical protein BDN71DRAFT_604864 [Pleurotus eryngii]